MIQTKNLVFKPMTRGIDGKMFRFEIEPGSIVLGFPKQHVLGKHLSYETKHFLVFINMSVCKH